MSFSRWQKLIATSTAKTVSPERSGRDFALLTIDEAMLFPHVFLMCAEQRVRWRTNGSHTRGARACRGGHAGAGARAHAAACADVNRSGDLRY